MLAYSEAASPVTPLESFGHLARNPYLAALDPHLVATGYRLLQMPSGPVLPGDDRDAAHILALACEHIAETDFNARPDALRCAFAFTCRLPISMEDGSYDADLSRLHGLALGLAAGDWSAVRAWHQQCPPALWNTDDLLWPRRALRTLVLAWDALVGEGPEALGLAGTVLEALVDTASDRTTAYLETLDVEDRRFAQGRLYALECAVSATERLVRRLLNERPRRIDRLPVDELWEQAYLITPDDYMQRLYGWLREASRMWISGGHSA